MGPILVSSQIKDQLEIMPSLGVLEILIKPSKGLRKEKWQEICFHEASGLVFTGFAIWFLPVPNTGVFPSGAGAGSLGRVSNVGSFPPSRYSGPSRFYSPKPSNIQVLDGGSSDAHVITSAQTYMTQTTESHRWSQRSPQTRTPLHGDTQGCAAEARAVWDSPSPSVHSSGQPPEFSLLPVGAVSGKKGLGRRPPETPHAMTGASEGTSGRGPPSGAQECPLLDMKGWCSSEREAWPGWRQQRELREGVCVCVTQNCEKG